MAADPLLALLPTPVAPVETGSVTGAARRVGVSRPRMSARSAQLRGLLGDRIPVPAGRRRGLVATDQAVEWARLANTRPRTLQAGFSRARFVPAGARQTFRVMANENATLAVCAPPMRSFRRIGDGLRPVLFRFDRSQIAGLDHGTLDVVPGRPHQFRVRRR